MVRGLEMIAGEIHNQSEDIRSRMPRFFDKMEVPAHVDLTKPVDYMRLGEKENVKNDAGLEKTRDADDVGEIDGNAYERHIIDGNETVTECNKDEGSTDLIDSVENQESLTDEEKARIKEETGWSDEIIDGIQNMKQYEILHNAGLKEVEINGRKCLVKENIDLDYTDADGISNRDRINRKLSPLDSKTGEKIELHHLGQKVDSPLVELTEKEHRTGDYEDGKKNQSLWHDSAKETEVHGEGNDWKKEREEHWNTRSKLIEGGNN